MKKSIIILLLTVFYVLGYSQSNYPKYYIENDDTVGVILTVEQLQKIDNSLDILVLLEKLQLQCDSLNSQYLILIDKLNEKILLLDVKTKNLESQISVKDNMISNLENKNSLLEEQLFITESQIKIKDDINKELSRELRRQKFKKLLGYIGAGIATSAFILVSIF